MLRGDLNGGRSNAVVICCDEILQARSFGENAGSLDGKKHEWVRTVLFCLGKSTTFQNFLQSRHCLKRMEWCKRSTGSRWDSEENSGNGGGFPVFSTSAVQTETWQRWFPSRLVLRRKIVWPCDFSRNRNLWKTSKEGSAEQCPRLKDGF